jgi:hypothetical protein
MKFIKHKSAIELNMQTDLAQIRKNIRTVSTTVNENKDLVEGMREHLDGLSKLVAETINKN